MSDAVPATPPAAPATTAPPKKTKAAKPKGERKTKPVTHPVYGAMIQAAIKELKDRKGASKQAILKYIIQKYKVGDNEKQINARLRVALKKGVKDGHLKQASGTGAAGRFRLAADKAESPAKPKVARKPKAATEVAKPKTAAAKPKTPKAKKEKSAKSPKKAAKPKAKSAKSPKKTATPKKKAAPKPKTAKKPAAKKAAPPAKA
ncbi:unnamed protein product [Strongylus vulgaris]|uniref:H15 domain-containing protein n=1 Tax=Strongylus vulgaris TaxID=40348 RepID=A0A3P7JPG2_STRVU|nr:unnamed protein product [Strongylus vulgaris]